MKNCVLDLEWDSLRKVSAGPREATPSPAVDDKTDEAKPLQLTTYALRHASCCEFLDYTVPHESSGLIPYIAV